MRYATVVAKRALARLLGDAPRPTAKAAAAQGRRRAVASAETTRRAPVAGRPQGTSVRSVAPSAAQYPGTAPESTSTVGTLASIAAIGVVAAATSGAQGAIAPPSRRPRSVERAQSTAVEGEHVGGHIDTRTMPHVPGTVRRIPHTRAQLAMSRPAGSPGSVLPPLRRAAPDRTIWRAPEIKDLPPDLADDEGGRPAPHWNVTDVRDARHFARRATPRPTEHRTPGGLTRRSWRRHDPVNLGLSAEELGLTLPAVVEDQPRRSRPAAPSAHAELAGLAIAHRTGELVGVPIEPEAEPWDLGFGAAPQAELAGLVRRPVRERGRIRTLIDGEDVAAGITVEQPATVALERLVRVTLAHDLERARVASARAAASAVAASRRAERSIASGVALLVLIASLIGVTPLSQSAGATGNVGREATPTRIGIGVFSAALGAADVAGRFGGDDGSDGLAVPDGIDGAPALGPQAGNALTSAVSLDLSPIETTSPDAASRPSDPGMPLADRFLVDEEPVGNTDDQGPFNADGTLVKPVAVDTTVPDGKDQLRSYKVRKGDTAADIAKRFKVTTATVVWSNGLVDAPALKIGQTLVIPPVNGLVHVVQDGDTLSAIARKTGVDFRRIMDANGLTETTVFIGQTLIIPGGKGEHIGTPPAAAGADLSPDNPARRNTVTVPRRSVAPPATYGGGAFAWPLPGGSISQYFHYGHYGLDIAGDYGLPVYAAAPGTVTFAGWKNNGGGWQVWIAHGSGLYTTYNHMSGVSVGVGQAVAKGQAVGRNGSSGYATGPHVHFEVWAGPVWDGGRRVNPLSYL